MLVLQSSEIHSNFTVFGDREWFEPVKTAKQLPTIMLVLQSSIEFMHSNISMFGAREG